METSGIPAPLSVLDLAPVSSGSSPADALAHSVELARVAERLGYRRFWVAEHHNMVGVASSSPPVLLAHIASRTTSIRLGSGGVMLPNHASLTIAEQFGMLEALHPGRIDLGLGRAPGTDLPTVRALRRHLPTATSDEFPRQIGELLGFFGAGFPPEHPYATITAVPAHGYQPALWILGSSDYGAKLAGLFGLPFAFAHHFAPENLHLALERYRDNFRPSSALEAPYAMVTTAALVAPSDEEADWLAGPARLNVLRIRTNRRDVLASPEEAAAYRYSPEEKLAVRQWTASHFVGSPSTVRHGLARLVKETEANEIMVSTSAHAFADRCRSLELLSGFPAERR